MKKEQTKKLVNFTKKLLPKKVEILFDKIPLGCYNATIGGVLRMKNYDLTENVNTTNNVAIADKVIDTLSDAHKTDCALKRDIIFDQNLTFDEKKYFIDKQYKYETDALGNILLFCSFAVGCILGGSICQYYARKVA